MKPNLKAFTAGAILFILWLLNSCIKDKTTPILDKYSSLQDFYAKNGVPIQTYNINGSTGGSFTTSQGTIVIVPANCFNDRYGNLVTGPVTILFKDIYTKSDMLLSNMTPMTYYGGPLKSGGEFFIKAISNGNAVTLNGNGPIKVSQPLNNWAADKMMQPFRVIADSFNVGWQPSPKPDTVSSSLSGYVFALYSFGSPADSGTWCNSDNSSYFSAYPQTQFTIQTTDDSINMNNISVFLVFTGLNSLVHVYQDYNNLLSFPYGYAPQGLPCTVVAVETRANGQLRSAFVPTTITANGTVNFNCTPTTTAAFKT